MIHVATGETYRLPGLNGARMELPYGALGDPARRELLALLQSPHKPRPEPRPLTRRQNVVLELVATGCANKEIAARLAISEQAVKKHLAKLMRRYAVPNRAALVSAAIGDGAIEPANWRASPQPARLQA